MFVGGEDRSITAWDTNSGKVVYSIEDAHSARIKGIVVLTRKDNDGAAEDPYLVSSASSDGVIRVWDVRMAAKEKASPLAEANTKSRLTCLAGSSLKCEYHAYFLAVVFVSSFKLLMFSIFIARNMHTSHLLDNAS